MSALTYAVKDRQNPDAAWPSTTCPQFKEIQTESRIGAGRAAVMMPPG